MKNPFAPLLAAAAAVLLLVLAAAPMAQASQGVVGRFDKSLQSNSVGGPTAVAVNRTGAGGVAPGTIYVLQQRQIDVYSPQATWLATWGWNVTGIDERQKVVVNAGGGSFTLSFGGNTTVPILTTASSATVTSALAALPSIGANNVTAEGSAGNWTVVFTGTTGALGGTDVAQMTINGAGLTGTNSVDGGAPIATVETLVNGAGGNANVYEICTEQALCSAPKASPTTGPNGGTSSEGSGDIAVDQADGSVYFTDRGWNRVQKFSATGQPILVFGKEVNATVPGTGPEVCTVASGNTCKPGAVGTAGGEWAKPNSTAGNGIAVAPATAPNAGNVLVTDGTSYRVQEFTSGGVFLRTFGWDVISRTSPKNDPRNEVQQVKIPATDGTFTLNFGANTTAALPYNISAAALQTALNGLASVNTGGGSVTVTGGPGDATGSTPYVVTFDGGPRSDTDVKQMIANGRNLGIAAGTALTCSGPVAQTLAFQWLRNGKPISGATASTYVVTAADSGAVIQCQVFASNPGPGAAVTQTSVPFDLAAPVPSTPVPVPPATLPNVTPTFLPGQTKEVGGDGGFVFNCLPGTWQNSPTFSYQWYRNGQPLVGHGADTAKYIVQKEDIAETSKFQCAVTGTNGGGSVTALTIPSSQSETSPGPVNGPSAAFAGIVLSDVASVKTTTIGSKFEICTVSSECKAGIPDEVTGPDDEPGQFSNLTGTNAPLFSPSRVAVNSAGVIYTVEWTRLQKFTPSGSNLIPATFGTDQPPPAGAPNTYYNTFFGSPGFSDNYWLLNVAIGENDHVLVAKQYGPGATPSCPDGTASIFERRVQELSSDGTQLLDSHGSCSNLNAGRTTVGLAVNPATKDIYEIEQDEAAFKWVYILGGANNDPDISIDTTAPTTTNALVSGTVTPDPVPTGYPEPPKTSWQLEYKLSSASAWIKFRKPLNVGNGAEAVPFDMTLTPLLPNTSYDVRAVATKQYNSAQTISPVDTFVTEPAPPSIESVRSLNVEEDAADLNARINPQGSETTYHFEYGTTSDLGQVTPELPVGGGQGVQSVTTQITGISDLTYYFRVVAHNDAGTTVGEKQTFVFHPPSCPNQLLRQQTGASYLPDCRALELVSPGSAGNGLIDSFTGPWSGYATEPSRLAYLSMFSPLPVSGNPPNNFDLYVSTRTTNGWTTEYVGLPATEAFSFGGPPGIGGEETGLMKNVQVSPRMDKILLWNRSGSATSNAPYVFGPNGQLLERFPSNLASISEGNTFKAQVYQLLASGDLTHFIFASNIPFLPGAPADAIYDNDVESGSISIVNTDPNGVPYTGFPADVSMDGSHILMSTACAAACPSVTPSAFYMRVDGTETLDVTKGHKGRFAGMTRDGSKVYILSSEQMTSTDHDASADLFMWSEATDDLTQVSIGDGGSGNSDKCQPVDTWTTSCSVKLISQYELRCPTCDRPAFYNGEYTKQVGAAGGNVGNDNFVAGDSGDIYFFSPERLAGPSEGAYGMQNLYVFRQGEVHFVASLDPAKVCALGTSNEKDLVCASGPIGRIQVAPNGDFAAFTATSRLTGYDNDGFEMMYRYYAPTEQLTCVSCVPDGSKPTARVEGSQNGLFMTSDGRTFFSTPDALATNDTNEAEDVYEYVDGRPQLITRGTGATMDPACRLCGVSQFVSPGLIGVSANGMDVYFGTYDVLTSDDHNGGNLKIYDARAGGGFAFAPPTQPCEAADECHGLSAGPPPPMTNGTAVNLGDRGNESSPRKTRKSCKSSKRRAKNRKATHQVTRSAKKARTCRQSHKTRRGANK